MQSLSAAGPRAASPASCSPRGDTACSFSREPPTDRAAWPNPSRRARASCCRAVGVLDAVESAGFPQNRGNTVYWGSRTAAWKASATPARARASRYFVPTSTSCCWRTPRRPARKSAPMPKHLLWSFPTRSRGCRIHGEGWKARAHGRFAIDCSGRSGIIARRGLRVYEPVIACRRFSGLWRNGRRMGRRGRRPDHRRDL